VERETATQEGTEVIAEPASRWQFFLISTDRKNAGEMPALQNFIGRANGLVCRQNPQSLEMNSD
jgi:hypothetical protein